MALPQYEEYTVEDIYNLPEGTRAELIDGQIYYMAPPTESIRILPEHYTGRLRTISTVTAAPVRLYAPFAVFLNEDDKTTLNQISP